MANPNSNTPKSQLRRTMRQALQQHSADSVAACAALNGWLGEQPPGSVIASFSALPGEVDLTACLAAHPAMRWVFPRVVGADLSFHLAKIFVRGAFGILEPSADSPQVPLETIDAFLCPGLAFSTHGERLGRGRGFYDRALTDARKDALKIGVCFAFQIVPTTFPELHDIAMDRVFY